MTSQRSGVTIYMVLAIILCVAITGASIVLHSIKHGSPPPFLVKQNAVYQMESAVMLSLPKLERLLASDSKTLYSVQEIAPGMRLSLAAEPAGVGRWKLKATVESPYWSKTLEVLAERQVGGSQEQNGSIALRDGNESAALSGWSLRFLEPTSSPGTENQGNRF